MPPQLGWHFLLAPGPPKGGQVQEHHADQALVVPPVELPALKARHKAGGVFRGLPGWKEGVARRELKAFVASTGLETSRRMHRLGQDCGRMHGSALHGLKNKDPTQGPSININNGAAFARAWNRRASTRIQTAYGSLRRTAHVNVAEAFPTLLRYNPT